VWVTPTPTRRPPPPRAVCERLLELGVLAKDTQDTTVRLAPPLMVSRGDLEWALERIVGALAERA
jgi:ornithine--oxo-acid transaminase